MADDILIRHRQATVEEYTRIREDIDWSVPIPESIEMSLGNTLFSVCLESAGRLIGYGRVVGDGGLYFYLQDIIVVPKSRGHGYADIIMGELMTYVSQQVPKGAFVGLFSVKGNEPFYEKYGFQRRPSDTYGCGMFLHATSK